MLISPDNYLKTPEGLYFWSQARVEQAWGKSREEYSEALASGNYKKVTLLMGAPGSGKSTWVSQNHQEGVIYFDATFKNARARAPFLQEAQATGIPVEVVWLDTSLEECLHRNALRTPDRKVSDGILTSMWETINRFPPDPRKEGSPFTLIRVQKES